MLQFSNDIVLISGTEDYVSIAIDCGLKKVYIFIIMSILHSMNMEGCSPN